MNNLTVHRLVVSLLLIAFVTSAILTVQAFSATQAVKAQEGCLKAQYPICQRPAGKRRTAVGHPPATD